MVVLVGTKEAAKLMRICTQRVLQLIYEGRIRGARKVGRFWKIPLYDNKPKVAKGTRGPIANWSKRLSRVPTIIHVNQQNIRNNSNNGTNIPVVRVQQGSKISYYHDIEIKGNCKLVYRNKPLKCGAKVWLKVEPHIEVIPIFEKETSPAPSTA